MSADISLTEVSDIILNEGRISPDHYRSLEGRILFWGIVTGIPVVWMYQSQGPFGFWIAFPLWTGFFCCLFGWFTAKIRRARDMGYSGTGFLSVVGGLSLLATAAMFFSGQPLGQASLWGYMIFQLAGVALLFTPGQPFDSRFGARPAIYTETELMQFVSWGTVAFYVGMIGYILTVQIGLAEDKLSKAIGPLPFMEGFSEYTNQDFVKDFIRPEPIGAVAPDEAAQPIEEEDIQQ
ncbi:MAG: hypothetical protein GC134_05530 [Proteobacteria bacterium]|nr:hypothetical protein [Pseudomonadota bacterium]